MYIFNDVQQLTEFVTTATKKELADKNLIVLFAGKPSIDDFSGKNVSITSLQLIDSVLENIEEPQLFSYFTDLLIMKYECSLSGSPYDYIDELGNRKSYTGTNFGKFVSTHIKEKVKQRQRIFQMIMKYSGNTVEIKEKEEITTATNIEEDEMTFLPKELQNERAFALLEYLRDAGWLDDVFHPTRIGEAQEAVVCHLICDELGIKNCWKVSSELTGKKGMRDNFKKYKEKHKFDFIRLEKEFKKEIRKFHKYMKDTHLPH